ncbi:hypothetical protein PENTCL1PPCAC_15540, partial [Pristionchus entomophagus]
RCQKHLTDLGGDYAEASKCVKAHQKKIEEAAACTRKNLGELCAAEPGKEVPKRFHETLQIAAVKEITDMVKKSGLLGKTTELFEVRSGTLAVIKRCFQVAKKSAGCMLKCADSTSCAKKLKCGLALPGDNEVVATAKKCALEAGFTTPVAREICTCLSKAGVKKLDDICPSITIS